MEKTNPDFKWLLYLLIIFTPVMFYLHVGFKINISATDFVMPICLVYFLYGIRSYKNDSYPFLYRIFIYIAFIIISMLISIWAQALLKNHYPDNIFYNFTNIFKVAVNGVYLLFFYLFLSLGDMQKFLSCLKVWKVISGLFSVICILGVVLYYLGLDLGLTLAFRAKGTFEDPNLAASYILISLCLVLFLNAKMKKRLIDWHFVLAFIALVLTASRGGFLAAVTGATFIVVFFIKTNGRVFMTNILLLIAGILLILPFFNTLFFDQDFILNKSITRLMTIGTEGDGTGYRLLLWKTALNLWTENIYLGVGTGRFIEAAQMNGYMVGEIPHNTYLTFLSESGSVGFLSFIWFPIYLLKKLLDQLKGGDLNTLFLIAGLVGFAIQGLTIDIENFRVMWMFFAMVLYYISQNDGDEINEHEQL